MNIAFFSAVTYDSVIGGRTRRLADELAERHQVHFIDMPSLRHPGLCGRKTLPGGIIRYHIAPMPFLWRSFDTPLGELWVRGIVRFLGRCLPPDTRVVVSTPFWVPVLRKLKVHSITYDCLDHVSVQSSGAFGDRVERLENILVMISRQIVCVSRHLAGLWNNRSRKPVHIVSNGFPADFLSRPAALPDSPVAGFCGAMYEWFDFSLVEKCARALPDVRFILTGPVRNRLKLLGLSRLANVEINPALPFERVPDEIGRCTVGMIPFEHGEVAFFSDPIKSYEYSALGRAVVSTVDCENGLPLHVAGDADGFIATLGNLLDSPPDPAALRSAVAGRSWGDIAKQMERILE